MNETIDITNLNIALILDTKGNYEWHLLLKQEDDWSGKQHNYTDLINGDEITMDNNLSVISYIPKNINTFQSSYNLIGAKDIKSIEQIYTDSRPFFDQYENTDKSNELESIRHIYSIIGELIHNSKNGVEVEMDFIDYFKILNTLIEMYTYAYGNFMDHRFKRTISPINSEDEFDLNNLYRLAIKNEKGESDKFYAERRTDIPLSDLNAKDNIIQVYKNLENKQIYYVKSNGKVYTNSNGHLLLTPITVTKISGFKELFDRSKEHIYSLDHNNRLFSLAQNECRAIESYKENRHMLPIYDLKEYLPLFESLIFMNRAEINPVIARMALTIGDFSSKYKNKDIPNEIYEFQSLTQDISNAIKK